jgi:hypothetical protein
MNFEILLLGSVAAFLLSALITNQALSLLSVVFFYKYKKFYRRGCSLPDY